MAQLALKEHNFDKILFIPAYNPPHKNVALAQDRFNMVELAIKNCPKFEISDIEYKRKKIKNMCVNYNKVINETISIFNDYDEIVLKLNRIREKVDESPQVNLRSFLSRFEV